MAPRNNDANSSFKKCDDNDDVKHYVPCLLHKKHKVIKLIKSQLENVSQEGIFTDIKGCESESVPADVVPLRLTALRGGEEVDMNSGNTGRSRKCIFFLYIFLILLIIFGLIVLMVWISSGPLSNSVPHTPINCHSVLRTDCLCSLEKKYLLRWSKPEYFE